MEPAAQQDQPASEKRYSLKTKIDDALALVQNLKDESVASIFAIVPEANLPVICTGQRCASGDEEFVVLGYKESGEKTDLSMIASQNLSV
jgi:hypothetical protein